MLERGCWAPNGRLSWDRDRGALIADPDDVTSLPWMEVRADGAAIIYPDIPGTDPFWSAGARSLFLGITLYVLETPSLPPTLGEVLRQGMASDSEGFSHHWKRIIEGRKSGRFPLSGPCVRALSDVIDLAPVTASSIRKTFTSRLDLLANPLLDRATSRNDFDLRELRRRPISIYIGIRPADLHRLKPLLNLFIEQAIGLQTKTLPELLTTAHRGQGFQRNVDTDSSGT